MHGRVERPGYGDNAVPGYGDNAVLGKVEGQGTGIMLRWKKLKARVQRKLKARVQV